MLLLLLLAVGLRVSPLALLLDLSVAALGVAALAGFVAAFLYPQQFPAGAVWLAAVLAGWWNVHRGAMAEQAEEREESSSAAHHLKRGAPNDQQTISNGT